MQRKARLVLVVTALAVLAELAALHGHAPAGGAAALRADPAVAGEVATQPDGGCGLCRLANELRTRAPLHGAAASHTPAGPALRIAADGPSLAGAHRVHASEAPRAPPAPSLLALG
jgi:hypothetical protein